MKTTKLFTKAALLSLGLAISGSAFAVKTLHVGTWLPPTNPQNAVVWPTWAKWVEEATEGRVKVEIEHDLGHPKTMFQLVEDGVVDAGFSYHGYVPGRFQLTEIAELPGLGVGAEAGSVALWRIYNKYFMDAGEFEGLTLLGMFCHGPGYIQSVDPITSFDQIKGKKIRIGGGVQSELGKRMGVTAVSAPAPKVYEMMQQGVIDGAFLPLGEQKTLRLNEVARNVTMLPGGMYLGTFSMFISPYFLDQLEPRDRKAIMSVSGEKLSALAGRAWDGIDEEGLKAAEDAGVNLIRVKEGDPMAKNFKKLIQGMDEQWIEKVSDRDSDARQALKELRTVAREYQREHQE